MRAELRLATAYGGNWFEHGNRVEVHSSLVAPALPLRPPYRLDHIATFEQLAAIIGHVLRVVAAHDRAVRLLPSRHALAGQLQMLFLMVGYTLTDPVSPVLLLNPHRQPTALGVWQQCPPPRRVRHFVDSALNVAYSAKDWK